MWSLINNGRLYHNMEDLKERVLRYMSIEEEALGKITVSPHSDSFLYRFAEDSLNLIRSYYEDSKYFIEKGDLLNAFAAINYSYGWIDALVRLGVLDGKGDHRLFTNFS